MTTSLLHLHHLISLLASTDGFVALVLGATAIVGVALYARLG